MKTQFEDFFNTKLVQILFAKIRVVLILHQLKVLFSYYFHIAINRYY